MTLIQHKWKKIKQRFRIGIIYQQHVIISTLGHWRSQAGQ